MYRKTVLIVSVTLLLTFGALAQCTPAPSNPVIGTFDARAVSLAYHRSPAFGEMVSAVRQEHAQAKAAGDTKRLQEIEMRMTASQADAHRQVFGVGPYDSLFTDLRPMLAKVAAERCLTLIVPGPYYATNGVQVQDVTPALLDELKASPETRNIIADVTEKIRTGAYKPQDYKGDDDHR